MSEVKLAHLEEIQEGSILSFEPKEGKRFGLAKSQGKLFAFEDRCSHDDGELASGHIVEGAVIECPRHGARFDLNTGQAVRMPAVMPIQVYPIRIDRGEVWIELPEEGE